MREVGEGVIGRGGNREWSRGKKKMIEKECVKEGVVRVATCLSFSSSMACFLNRYDGNSSRSLHRGVLHTSTTPSSGRETTGGTPTSSSTTPPLVDFIDLPPRLLPLLLLLLFLLVGVTLRELDRELVPGLTLDPLLDAARDSAPLDLVRDADFDPALATGPGFMPAVESAVEPRLKKVVGEGG